MRARNIKPGFFKNEILGQADPVLSLLFAGLWCLADKAGRLEDRPLRIRAELFPYRDGLDINRYLTELERLGFIQRYVVNEITVIQVLKFEDHQHPHHTERESELPENTNGCLLTVKEPLINRHTPSDSLIPDSLIPELPPTPKGEVKQRAKRGSAASQVMNNPEAMDTFRAAWQLHPRRRDTAGNLRPAGNQAKGAAALQARVAEGVKWEEVLGIEREYLSHPDVKNGYAQNFEVFWGENGHWFGMLQIVRMVVA